MYGRFAKRPYEHWSLIPMLPPLRYWTKSRQVKNQDTDGLPPKLRIEFQNGRFRIPDFGVWYAYWQDPYHLMLVVPWWGFFAVVILFYIATNFLFAIAYFLGGDCIANARPGSLLDLFFFSVQTLSTIGYGGMAPTTLYANIMVAIESLTGLLGTALITGLAFARFAQPTARVAFSRIAVVRPYNGIPTLMFRTANQRRNQILEAEMKVYLMRDEISSEGEFMRRLYPVELLSDRTPTFTISWTVMHAITESSPFYGMTSESLEQMRSTLVASLSGIDETVAQAVQTRHTYAPNEILWNHQFVDIIYNTEDGHRYADFRHFHRAIEMRYEV